jgi:hypothetical protein
MPEEDRRLHEGIIRGLIQMIRAWQDWLKAKAKADPQQPQQQEPK